MLNTDEFIQMSGSNESCFITDICNISTWRRENILSLHSNNNNIMATLLISQLSYQLHQPTPKHEFLICNYHTTYHFPALSRTFTLSKGKLACMHVVVRSPVKPGVAAAIFLAMASRSRLGSSLSGRRWTLNMDARPLISGGPERSTEHKP